MTKDVGRSPASQGRAGALRAEPPEASQAKPLVPNAAESTVPVHFEGTVFNVDASIAHLVTALNRAGFQTIASCSGHGYRPGNIALRDGRELIVARNYGEARLIERLFPVTIGGERLSLEGTRLKRLRKAAGLKAIDLAAAIGVSPEHLSRMECGHKPITRAVELAVALVCGSASAMSGSAQVAQRLDPEGAPARSAESRDAQPSSLCPLCHIGWNQCQCEVKG